MQPTYKATIVFDLDDTLCTSKTDAKGDYVQASPIKERIIEVNRLYDAGYEIIIDSARGSKFCYGSMITELYNITNAQLSLWGVKFHKLRVGVKFAGDIYIDDRFKEWKYLHILGALETLGT
jgi:hypothetical protein